MWLCPAMPRCGLRMYSTIRMPSCALSPRASVLSSRCYLGWLFAQTVSDILTVLLYVRLGFGCSQLVLIFLLHVAVWLLFGSARLSHFVLFLHVAFKVQWGVHAPSPPPKQTRNNSKPGYLMFQGHPRKLVRTTTPRPPRWQFGLFLAGLAA